MPKTVGVFFHRLGWAPPPSNMEADPLLALAGQHAPASNTSSAPDDRAEPPFKQTEYQDSRGDSLQEVARYPAGIIVRPWAERRIECAGCDCTSVEEDYIFCSGNEFMVPPLSMEWGYHEIVSGFVDPQPVGELCSRIPLGFYPPVWQDFLSQVHGMDGLGAQSLDVCVPLLAPLLSPHTASPRAHGPLTLDWRGRPFPPFLF